VRTTNNNSTGKVVIPLVNFKKMGPVRYDAAGTTGQRRYGVGLSNIACVSDVEHLFFLD